MAVNGKPIGSFGRCEYYIVRYTTRKLWLEVGSIRVADGAHSVSSRSSSSKMTQNFESKELKKRQHWSVHSKNRHRND